MGNINLIHFKRSHPKYIFFKASNCGRNNPKAAQGPLKRVPGVAERFPNHRASVLNYRNGTQNPKF